jgi:hypothetical protein
VIVTDEETARIELRWLGLPDPAARGLDPRVELAVAAGDGTEIAVEIVTPLDPYPGTAARMIRAVELLGSLPPGFHTPAALAVA